MQQKEPIFSCSVLLSTFIHPTAHNRQLKGILKNLFQNFAVQLILLYSLGVNILSNIFSINLVSAVQNICKYTSWATLSSNFSNSNVNVRIHIYELIPLGFVVWFWPSFAPSCQWWNDEAKRGLRQMRLWNCSPIKDIGYMKKFIIP